MKTLTANMAEDIRVPFYLQTSATDASPVLGATLALMTVYLVNFDGLVTTDEFGTLIPDYEAPGTGHYRVVIPAETFHTPGNYGVFVNTGGQGFTPPTYLQVSADPVKGTGLILNPVSNTVLRVGGLFSNVAQSSNFLVGSYLRIVNGDGKGQQSKIVGSSMQFSAMTGALYDDTGGIHGDYMVRNDGVFTSYTHQSGDNLYVISSTLDHISAGLKPIGSKVDSDYILMESSIGTDDALAADNMIEITLASALAVAPSTGDRVVIVAE